MLALQNGQGPLWLVFALVVSSVLALDLGLFQKNPREPTPREALLWTGLWLALACLFGAGITLRLGPSAGAQFFTAYLLEEALSVDNLFVFLLVFAAFKVPRAAQRKVLVAGILGAVALRTLFIVAGASLVARFHFLTYPMGALLGVMALKLAFGKDEAPGTDAGAGESGQPGGWVVRLLRRVLPLTDQHDQARFFTRIDGRLLATPLVLALVAVETADVVFAVDSIPAVFGVTTDPFLALTSNIFAILGLRSLYFLLSGALQKLRYLKAGLAGVLGFVGAKMLLGIVWEIPTPFSLLVLLAILGVATAASLRSNRLLETTKGTDRC